MRCRCLVCFVFREVLQPADTQTCLKCKILFKEWMKHSDSAETRFHSPRAELVMTRLLCAVVICQAAHRFTLSNWIFNVTRLVPTARFISCYAARCIKKSSIRRCETVCSKLRLKYSLSLSLSFLQRAFSTGFLLWWMILRRRWPRLMWSELWLSG